MFRSGLLSALVHGLAAGCGGDADCSLLGDCVDGQCRCDAGWKGPRCAQLDLLPADRLGGYHNKSMASWCGSAVKSDGAYHYFGSGMSHGCNLSSFATNSMSVRATSASPGGPYAFQDVALPEFHHSTAIKRGKSGFLLFTIGKDMHGQNVHDCTRDTASGQSSLGSDFVSPHNYINIATAESVEGPWKERMILETDFKNLTAWNCNKTNPTAVVLNNGSVLMMYRGTRCLKDPTCHNRTTGKNTCEHQGIAIADSADSPFVDRQGRIFELDGNEDPFLFMNHRGFVALFHSKTICSDVQKGIDHGKTCGALAYSPDSWRWTMSDEPAYDGDLEWAESDGNVTKVFLASRQRPNVLFDEDGVTPLYLINGAQDTVDEPQYSLFTPFNVPANRGHGAKFV